MPIPSNGSGKLNTLQYATLLQTSLDEAAVRDMVTGWMDANAGQVKYTGGAEVRIPTLTTQGMGNYDRDGGYASGSVNLSWTTYTMTQDRGRKFQLDAMDVDETAFVATAAAVMGDFQRQHVAPEIDAYRLSKLAQYAIGADNAATNGTGMVSYGNAIAAAASSNVAASVLRAIKTGIMKIRDQGYNGDLVCHIIDAALMELELELAGKIQSVTFSAGGINTTVPSVDMVPLLATPANRMVTQIEILDGTTSGKEAGGFAKASAGKDINFIILPRRTPIAITKQDKMRIFDPDTNQKANAWAMDYRRYHDLWVLSNQVGSIYVNVKDAKSA